MDIEKIKNCLLQIALADHLGDVPLKGLCKALDIEVAYSSKWERYVFPWENDRWCDKDSE